MFGFKSARLCFFVSLFGLKFPNLRQKPGFNPPSFAEITVSFVVLTTALPL